MGLTKGRAAVHATRGLDLAFEGGVVQFVAFDGVEFAPVHDAFRGASVRLGVALVVDKTAQFFNTRVRSIATLDSAVSKIVLRESKERTQIVPRRGEQP